MIKKHSSCFYFGCTDSNLTKSAMRDLDTMDGKKEELAIDIKKTGQLNGLGHLNATVITPQNARSEKERAFQEQNAALTQQDRYKFLRSTLRYEFMTPDEQMEGREITPRDILLAFDDVTSTHGIPHIKYARGKKLRIIFTMSEISCAAIQ